MMTTNKELELQALITEREGMIADNEIRQHRQEYPAYTGEEFRTLADRIRSLKEPEGVLAIPHREQHKQLHKCLDELVADFIRWTQASLQGTNIMTLILWSADQCIDPTESKDGQSPRP